MLLSALSKAPDRRDFPGGVSFTRETAPVERRKRAPIVETLHDHWRIVIGFVGLSVFSAVGFYVSFVYLVSWLQIADGRKHGSCWE